MRNHRVNLRILIIIGCLLVLSSVLGACSSETQAVTEKQGKPVKVAIAEEQERPVVIEYTGMIEVDEVHRVSFPIAGEIVTLNIEENDYIRKGQLLAKLDAKDIDYSIRDAEAQIKTAQAQYDKALKGATAEESNLAHLKVKQATDAYAYTKMQQERILSLYEAGAVPLHDLDTIDLEYTIRKNELEQAKEHLRKVEKGADEEDLRMLQAQLDRAHTNQEQKLSLYKNIELRANVDGYVTDVLYKKGEIVGAGQPIILVRNDQKIVNVGIPQKDFENMSMGMQGTVVTNNRDFVGEIISISNTPDARTRLYSIKLALKGVDESTDDNSNKTPLGAIATVRFSMETESGIWVPIAAIMADDTDYIFIVENNQAVRREVVIEKVTASEARIIGVKTLERIVVEGMKRLNNGDEVVVIGEE